MTQYQQPPPGQMPPAPPAGYQQPQQPQYQQPAPQGYAPPVQQPQYPQQYPQQQPQYPQQQPQQQAQYPAPAAQLPPPPAQMPASHAVDDQQAQAAYRDHAERSSGFDDGPRPSFVKWLGPNGQTNWNGVNVGYQSHLRMLICSPWAPGKPVFMKQTSHFMLYQGEGGMKQGSVNCGRDGCRICGAVEAGMVHHDEAVQKKAKRSKTGYANLYNVFLLDTPQAHVGQDGIMRPFVLSAGSKMHKAIGDLADARGGMSAFANFEMGRVLQITKRKTGPEQMNIEYSVLDFDPIALPQEFWPGIPNMWDLEDLCKPGDPEMIARLLAKSSINFLASAGPASYSPHAQAPGPNPYGQMPPQQTAPGSTAYSHPPGAPPAPQYQTPVQSPVPMQVPPPVSSAVPPAQMPPPAQAAPPPQQPMAPPPVSSGAPAQGYQPQPSQPAPAPAPAQAPEQAPAPQGGPPELRPPFDPSFTLEGGRERCFSRYNADDRMCQSCPDWIRSQCVPQTQAPADGVPSLDALTQQLAGG